MTLETNFPATCTVHWPSGPVNCCDVHASALLTIAKITGAHVGVTRLEKGECNNCKIEKRI